MIIGGFQKFSLIDYPGKTSAIIFTTGCNFRCPYCHNPELVIPEKYMNEINISTIFEFLQNRQGKLDGVTITGGEPTLHEDLIEIINKIKNLGFMVKLDTNGSNPDIIKEIIQKQLIDYIAMDIKAPFEKYSHVVGNRVLIDKLKKSINLIMHSGVEYEFRTTVVTSLLDRKDLLEIVKTIEGAENYYLQEFIQSKTIASSLRNKSSYSYNDLLIFAKSFEKYVKNCDVR